MKHTVAMAALLAAFAAPVLAQDAGSTDDFGLGAKDGGAPVAADAKATTTLETTTTTKDLGGVTVGKVAVSGTIQVSGSADLGAMNSATPAAAGAAVGTAVEKAVGDSLGGTTGSDDGMGAAAAPMGMGDEGAGAGGDSDSDEHDDGMGSGSGSSY